MNMGRLGGPAMVTDFPGPSLALGLSVLWLLKVSFTNFSRGVGLSVRSDSLTHPHPHLQRHTQPMLCEGNSHHFVQTQLVV